MSKLQFKSLFTCALLTVSGFAQAGTLGDLPAEYRQVLAEGRVSYIADIDNDTLLLNRKDGFYSSGLRYSQVHALRTGDRVVSYGWRIGQELYTASDIKLAPQFVGPPDHPYAGWLYGGIYKEVGRVDGSSSRFGLDIGCLGPCAGGEWTQTRFHRVLNQPQPQGWSRQVRNEPGIVVYADIAPVRWTPAQSIDVTPGFNARFGNIFTDAGVSLQVRAGQLNVLPDGPTFHAFVRTEIHAVGYNATLQGGYFSNNNSHAVDPRRVVGEAQAGVVWSHGPYGVVAALVRRGNEIRGLPNSIGAQNYLHLRFSYTP